MKRIHSLIIAMSIVGLANIAHAQATFIWTNGSDVWQDGNAWTTNGGATGAVPGALDSVDFTNAGTYYVTITNSVSVNQVVFNNATLTTATITLDMGTNNFLEATQSGGTPPAFEIADLSKSTTTVYLAAAPNVNYGFLASNNSSSTRVLVGRNGIGTLIVTNGDIYADSFAMGNSSTGRGTIILSGAGVYAQAGIDVRIGNNSASAGNSLVISNSATMSAPSLKVGFAGGNGNSLLVDSGTLTTLSAGTSIGVGGGNNNTATVQNGGIWNDYGGTLTIGGTGSGNSLTIGTNSQVSERGGAGEVIISANNTLNLQGGELFATTVVTNFGTIKGFGVINDFDGFSGVINAVNRGLLTPGISNSLGTISFNGLTIAPASTTLMKLDVSQPGSNDFIQVLGGLNNLGGTLTVTNVGPALVDGDIFQLFSSFSFDSTGDFGVTNLPALANGLSWDTSQLRSGIIDVVPEPSSCAMLAMGAVALLGLWGRRRSYEQPTGGRSSL